MKPAAAMQDADLVQASLTGDNDAFGHIVSRYQSLVCSLAYSATGSLTHSEDLAQETFLTAWRQLRSLREPGRLRPWLCGIARNLTNTWLRTQGREPSYRAESLDHLAGSHSPGPLPGERAISHEEADLLWRSLQRIPDSYRVPLILFYREHHSIEAVAQALELSEDAVKQRLSRGRKMLHEEMLSFVETALEKTRPGQTFTLGVLAALPLTMSSAAAAAATTTTAATAGAATKSALSLASLTAFAGIFAGILFSWKTAVDDAKSPREKKFMTRIAWIQIAFAAFSIFASSWILGRLSQRPALFGLCFGVLILANVINAVVLLTWVLKRRLEIGFDEGTWADAAFQPGDPQAASKASRRALKLTIPFIIMFAAGTIYLPWQTHWVRSAVVTAAESLVIVWAFSRFKRMHSAPHKIRTNSVMARHPLLFIPLIIIGCAALGGVLGAVLPFFLHPEGAKHGFTLSPQIRALLSNLLLLILGYAVFALLYFSARKFFPRWAPLASKLPLLFNTSLDPKAALEESHGPLFRQLNLPPAQEKQLRDLILKNTTTVVAKTMPLLNRKLDPARRSTLMAELVRERDQGDAQLRQLLGEAHYRTFLRYGKTVPDRKLIHDFNQANAKTSLALNPTQAEQLLEALALAREQYTWSTDLSRRTNLQADCFAVFSQKSLSIYAREEESFQASLLPVTSKILSPEQLTAFTKLQAEQRRTQLTMFEMAARLFAN